MDAGDLAVDRALIYFSQQGLYPAKGESMGDFFTRVACLEPAISKPGVPDSFIKEATALIGGWPKWVVIDQNRKGLTFFERGASFIDDEDVARPIHIHLKTMKEASRLDKEVFLHELVHAIRYKESDASWLEEPVAYFFSSSRFRKWFGATFRQTSHHWTFLALALLPLTALFMPEPAPIPMMLLSLPAIMLLFINMARSFKSTRLLSHCFKQLQTSLGTASAKSVLIRLTDEEIKEIATLNPSTFSSWLSSQKKQNIKWRQIALTI